MVKHFRLVVIWTYHLAFVIFFTLLMAYGERALGNRDEFRDTILEYILCVYTSYYTGGKEECLAELRTVPVIPYGLLLPARMVQSFYPILLFLVFGARWSMLNFWKEYLKACWKNKRLYLQFTPPFDPSLTISESRVTREDDDEMETSLSSSALNKIKRAITDL